MGEIKSALTAEEWDSVASYLETLRDTASVALEHTGSQDAADAETRLEAVIDSIRAGHPFGFTWEDVDTLKTEWEDEWSGTTRPNAGDALLSIADRIANLLPPRP